MTEKKELDNELDKVAAGEACDEPEEFDWRTKGYVTPKKDQASKEDGWKFEAIGTIEDFFKKIIHKG